MFFLMRSAICIGLVVAALPEEGRPTTARPAAVTAAAASGARAFCRAAPARCLALFGAGLRAGSTQAYAAFPAASLAAAMPSVDTLLAADRMPDWHGERLARSD